MNKFKTYTKAMRLPFLSASILPYAFGSFFKNSNFDWLAFILGLCAIISGHIAANLFNDYADSISGVDDLDTEYYGFFGGTKLIQQGHLDKNTFFKLGLFFIGTTIISLAMLVIYLNNLWLILIVLGALFLAISYSCKPLQLAYHGLGELTVLLIFGPVAVLGGSYLQGAPITVTTFNMSLVFGLLTAAILVANEIPDASEDRQAGKRTLVVRIGDYNGFCLYIALIFAAYMLILFQYWLGNLNWLALLSFILIFIPFKSMWIMQRNYYNKHKLVEASKLVIAHQTIIGLILVLCTA